MSNELILTLSAMKELLSHQISVSENFYRPRWHLAAPVGLLNDPNGFIHYGGRYHVFYQWNPFACTHGAKFWGHYVSSDMVKWEHMPPALIPAESYESHGCYSGSAVDDNGVLTLFYTGNVKYESGRTAWQCLATVDDAGMVTKKGPVIGLPEGYTGHVRDPKVWRHNDHWYMVLGAQTLTKKGCVLLYRSTDLLNWSLLNTLAGAGTDKFEDFGYMWECPDLFTLEESDVLIVCPQGLEPTRRHWLNTFQCGYFTGSIDYERGRFSHGDFYELDHGFEFYAPQSSLSPDGRRLLIGWLGMPNEDEAYTPTIQSGWIHTLSCIRELTMEEGKLKQRPARELVQLRREHRYAEGEADTVPVFPVCSCEINIHFTGQLELNLADCLYLSVTEDGIVLKRKNQRTVLWEERYWAGTVRQLTLLCDHSSVEIFINDGEGTMSSCYFPQSDGVIRFSGEAELSVNHWIMGNS